MNVGGIYNGAVNGLYFGGVGQVGAQKLPPPSFEGVQASHLGVYKHDTSISLVKPSTQVANQMVQNTNSSLNANQNTEFSRQKNQ
mmetsp:Transcript_9237/g.15534  ORF Transcript_9237/g.15534 Transcript_9237/m.15534 type:complete len:85 (-) Transcript_9237:32-286(-)